MRKINGENLLGKFMGKINWENLWGKLMGKINGENLWGKFIYAVLAARPSWSCLDSLA